jgi:hypothetical protein
VPIIHKVIHKHIHHDIHCVHRRFGAGSNEQDRPGRASALSDTPRSETSLRRRARNEEDTGGLVFPTDLSHDRALFRARLRRLSSVVAEVQRVGRGSAGLEGECREHLSSGREPRRLQSSPMQLMVRSGLVGFGGQNLQRGEVCRSGCA